MAANYIPVPSVDYQGAYSSMGKDISAGIQAIPQYMRQGVEDARRYKQEDEAAREKKKKIQWLEEQMQDEKQYKTTMGNVVNQLMGDTYTESEKQAAMASINTSDPKTITAHVAEFATAINRMKTTQELYKDAKIARPIFGTTADYYKSMVDYNLSGLKNKAIATALAGGQSQGMSQIGGQPQTAPVTPQTPQNEAQPQSFKDYQFGSTIDDGSQEPSSVPTQQPPQAAPMQAIPTDTQRGFAQQIASQNFDLADKSVEAAQKTLPTDYQRESLKAKGDALKSAAAYKDAALKLKEKHDVAMEKYHAAANKIRQGIHDDLSIKNLGLLMKGAVTEKERIAKDRASLNLQLSSLRRLEPQLVRSVNDAKENGDSFGEEQAKQALDEYKSHLKEVEDALDGFDEDEGDMEILGKYWKDTMKKKTGGKYPDKPKPNYTLTPVP